MSTPSVTIRLREVFRGESNMQDGRIRQICFNLYEKL